MTKKDLLNDSSAEKSTFWATPSINCKHTGNAGLSCDNDFRRDAINPIGRDRDG